jgi:hypothetical protein
MSRLEIPFPISVCSFAPHGEWEDGNTIRQACVRVCNAALRYSLGPADRCARVLDGSVRVY